MTWNWTDIILLGARALLVIIFLVLGWRDLVMLVRRPPRMGTGFGRTWAVARTTIFEAWAGRVWMLPLLWFVGSLIIVSLVRPFDESERIPLYIRVLLMGQELLLLIMMAVMACVSFPRDRERKIVITNASKPINRFELLLGKMLGFSVMAAAMIIIMTIASWTILKVSDLKAQSRATEQNRLAEDDLLRRQRGEQIAPEKERRRLSEEGSLMAYNYIRVPPDGMSILGNIAFSTEPGVAPMRNLKGGSNERATYRFKRLEAPEIARMMRPGSEPFFVFQFPYVILSKDKPQKVQIQVNAVRSAPYLPTSELVPQTRTLNLDAQGMAKWQPDEPQRLFSLLVDDGTPTGYVPPDVDLGEVTVEVTCLTPGVLLQIFEGIDPDPVTGKFPKDAPFNIYAVGNRATMSAATPYANPVVRGFERRDRQEVAGPKESDLAAHTEEGGVLVEAAVFHFKGQDLKGIPIDSNGNFKLALDLYLDRTGNYGDPTQAVIHVISMDAPAEKHVVETTVVEKRLSTIDVPARFLGNPDESKRSDMYVMLYCKTRDHALSILEDSVRIELPQTPFAFNLLKSEFVILLEASLLIVICVTCSVRLGWPVAILLSSVCWLFGYFVDFIQNLQGMGGLAAIGYVRYGDKSAAYQFFDNAAIGVWWVLGVIASIVPNFLRYQPLEYLAELRNMPLGVLSSNFLWTVAYVLPFLAIAYLLARKQELG